MHSTAYISIRHHNITGAYYKEAYIVAQDTWVRAQGGYDAVGAQYLPSGYQFVRVVYSTYNLQEIRAWQHLNLYFQVQYLP